MIRRRYRILYNHVGTQEKKGRWGRRPPAGAGGAHVQEGGSLPEDAVAGAGGEVGGGEVVQPEAVPRLPGPDNTQPPTQTSKIHA